MLQQNVSRPADSIGLGRTPVPPPSLRTAPAARWDRFVFWLTAPASLDAAPPLSRLPAARDDFRETLLDLQGHEVNALSERIGQARTLRELWHLRAEVYRVVALHHSQSEAERRVAQLSRHFPTRGARSRFAPL
ncbi:hypothetical protein CKO44_00705 [Rubrivivax gelatinosus]|uniref:Uncharacterized protein n=1 Tax=Rubrivivax gelatinosus TaxID=28068 RepID=A0ABS1DR27_RUBGE|nr:hypothetical protein [Rubrivivax gelatinosus]MBK1611990.1 hypothetical protein [Rubrivivax gelatinosus]MBK1712416.1 hypothetical protein [Rubrivivax gelatinosus]